MTRTTIIAIDGAHARFFSLEIPEEPLTDGGARLIELKDFVNPDAHVPERLQFSDRMGRAHASPGGVAHALDDGRERHREEDERRWIRGLLDEMDRFARLQQSKRLVLVAEPRLLGVLRAQLVHERLHGVEIAEVGENVTRHPVAQIQSMLALRGLVPAAVSPDAGVFRPRGQPPIER